jgi:hypothetical protein
MNEHYMPYANAALGLEVAGCLASFESAWLCTVGVLATRSGVWNWVELVYYEAEMR